MTVIAKSAAGTKKLLLAQVRDSNDIQADEKENENEAVRTQAIVKAATS